MDVEETGAVPLPVVLVPGFWLGAWAWDEVVGHLRAARVDDVTALTLPGLEPDHPDRAAVALEDHVEAVRAAVASRSRPAVLVAHSGAGVPACAAGDRVPDRLAHVLHLDSAPATGALDPDFEGAEHPQPGATVREAPVLRDDARRRVPTTLLRTSVRPAVLQGFAASGAPWVGGSRELDDVRYLDLPTGHWPMWSRPAEVAAVVAELAGVTSPST